MVHVRLSWHNYFSLNPAPIQRRPAKLDFPRDSLVWTSCYPFPSLLAMSEELVRFVWFDEPLSSLVVLKNPIKLNSKSKAKWNRTISEGYLLKCCQNSNLSSEQTNNDMQELKFFCSAWDKTELNTVFWLKTTHSSCDKDESGRCLPDQSGTSYFHYCPRLVWEVLARLVWEMLARLVWDLIFSLLPPTRCLFFIL